MRDCVHDWALAALNMNVDVGYYWYAFDCIDATINGVYHFSHSARHAIQLVHPWFLENDTV